MGVISFWDEILRSQTFSFLKLIDQVRQKTVCIGINIVRKIYNQLYFLSVRRIRGNGQFRLVYHVTPSITWNESWSNRFSIQVAVAPLSQRSLQFPWDPSSSFWEYLRRVFCIFYPKTYSRAKIQRPKIQEFWENRLKEFRDTKTENLKFGKKYLKKRNRKQKISTLLQPVTGFNGRELFEDFYSGKFRHFADIILLIFESFCALNAIF